MKSHEYADLFPMMSTAEIARLAEDIQENGQADPIITFGDKILDGRNRFQACALVGIEPKYSEYDGDDALAYVISHNLHRRHLTESQRAMVAAKWAKLKRGGESGVHKTNPPIGGLPSATKTRNEAAELLSVGTSSIDRAKKVIKDAPELVGKIESGEMTVNAAYVTTKKTTDEPQSPPSREVSEPRQIKPTPYTPNIAEDCWVSARLQLDRINSRDKSRVRVLNLALAYIQNRIEKNI